MKLTPKYKKIKQIPYCCVPACIFMVLDRHKIKHGSQEDIGYELGLIVPRNKKKLFKKVRVGKMPLAGFGTQVCKKEYSINNFFKNNDIDFKETYYAPKDIKDIKLFIKNNIEKQNDIMVCFNNKALFGSGDFGHVCLVQEIKDDTVALVNPENDKSEDDVEISKLFKAILKHGKIRRGGFWIISKHNKNE